MRLALSLLWLALCLWGGWLWYKAGGLAHLQQSPHWPVIQIVGWLALALALYRGLCALW